MLFKNHLESQTHFWTTEEEGVAATDSQGLAQSVGSRAVLRKSGQNTLSKKYKKNGKWLLGPGLE